MLHIVQHPKTKKLEVVSIAKNGEFLSGTRQGFESKPMAIKHIRAEMKNYDTLSTYFQDDTGEVSVVYYIPATGRVVPQPNKPKPKYILTPKYK